MSASKMIVSAEKNEPIVFYVDSNELRGKQIQICFPNPLKPLPKETVTIALPAGTKLALLPKFGMQIYTAFLAEKTNCEISNNALVVIGKTDTLISSKADKVDAPVRNYVVSFPKGTMVHLENGISEVSLDKFKNVELTADTKIIVLPEIFTFVKSGVTIFRSRTDEEQEAVIPKAP